MQLHLFSQATSPGSRMVSRGAPFMAVFVLTAQVVAQNPVMPGSAGRLDAAISPAQTGTGSSSLQPTDIPAPLPVREEANLTSPQRIPFLALETGQNNGQSSSQSAPAATTQNTATTTKTKTSHHGLGVALAVVGTTALAAGILLYVGEQHAYCNSSSTGCNEAKDAGIALMPIGAGLAVTGFYFQFHH